MTDWTYLHVDRIHLVWVALAIIGGLLVLELRGRDALASFLSPVMQPRLTERASTGRTVLKLCLVFAAMLAAIAALMRPQGKGEQETIKTTKPSADVMFVLAQAGRHDKVIELAAEYLQLVDQRRDMYAILAMSLVALGKITEARTALAKSKDSRFPAVVAHAKAVVALAAKKPDLSRALELLRSAKDAPYPEWHWIASDPNLAKLKDHPAFAELLA